MPNGVAYAEIHDDERATTATEVLRRAVAWFVARNITVVRVLSDNGSAYRSHLWRDTCRELDITREEPTPTGPRPTARSNASTARWATAGRSAGSTPASHNAGRPSRAGSTSTPNTDPTPPSAASRLLPG
jgi:hypothetical protein